MSNWSASGQVKIERAKEHVGNLETEIKSFLDRDPYVIVTEEDLQARLMLYRSRIRAGPPLRFGAIAGDALHNLRSALDILWRRTWYPDGGGDTDKRNEFPIFDSADALKARYPRHRVVESRKKSAVKLLYTIEPYRGGNELLWMLHETNNADKHRLLIPVFARVQSLVSDPIKVKSPSGRTLRVETRIEWDRVLDPIEDGAVVFSQSIEHPAQVHMKAKPVLDIAFGECRPLKGKAILPTLLQIAGEVEGIAETFLRAGLVK